MKVKQRLQIELFDSKKYNTYMNIKNQIKVEFNLRLKLLKYVLIINLVFTRNYKQKKLIKIKSFDC